MNETGPGQVGKEELLCVRCIHTRECSAMRKTGWEELEIRAPIPNSAGKESREKRYPQAGEVGFTLLCEKGL